MGYWVYLGEEPEAGPFPTYVEAHRERTYLLTGLVPGCSPAIFKIRTDEFVDGPVPPPLEMPGYELVPSELLKTVHGIADSADWQSCAKYPEQFGPFCASIVNPIERHWDGR